MCIPHALPYLVVAGNEVDRADGLRSFLAEVPPYQAPVAPLPEPTVPDMGFGTRTRYVFFSCGTLGASDAVRVSFDFGEDERMWVGEPTAVCELSGF